MARLLRNVGFEVVEGSNLGRDKMTEKLLDFGKKAEGADVAVFYYAGHGIAVNGTNYLLPVDADLKSEMDVKLGAAINIDLTLEQTMGDAKVKLVFLDACRDNPFAAKIRSAKATRSVNVATGLAEMKSGSGTLLAFATGPGQTAFDGEAGTNSPFTRALLANIAQPGVEIQQAMTKVRAQVSDETANNQLPWGHTNLTGSVYLNPPTADTTETAGAPVAAGPASEVELEFWRSIKNSNKVEELNAYLTNYPNGTFKPIALARIASLQDGPSTATRNLTTTSDLDPATFTDEGTQVTEDQLGLNKIQRRDVQRRLTGLGFDVKATGKFDEETRSVISRWQAARGYPKTGYINSLQHKALQTEILATKVASSDDDEPAARPSRRRSGGGARHYNRGGGAGGGPGALFGGMMRPLFGRWESISNTFRRMSVLPPRERTFAPTHPDASRCIKLTNVSSGANEPRETSTSLRLDPGRLHDRQQPLFLGFAECLGLGLRGRPGRRTEIAVSRLYCGIGQRLCHQRIHLRHDLRLDVRRSHQDRPRCHRISRQHLGHRRSPEFGDAFGGGDGERLDLSGARARQRTRQLSNRIDAAAEQIGKRGTCALIRNVGHLDAGHAVHHLAGKVQRRAEAGRCVGVFLGSFLQAASSSWIVENGRSFLAQRIFGSCHMPPMKVKSPTGS